MVSSWPSGTFWNNPKVQHFAHLPQQDWINSREWMEFFYSRHSCVVNSGIETERSQHSHCRKPSVCVCVCAHTQPVHRLFPFNVHLHEHHRQEPRTTDRVLITAGPLLTLFSDGTVFPFSQRNHNNHNSQQASSGDCPQTWARLKREAFNAQLPSSWRRKKKTHTVFVHYLKKKKKKHSIIWPISDANIDGAATVQSKDQENCLLYLDRYNTFWLFVFFSYLWKITSKFNLFKCSFVGSLSHCDW